jgi:acyl transferase domain-containing protein
MLSAKSKTSLEKQILKWQKFLEEKPKINLGDVFFTLAVGRPVFEYRIAFLVSSGEEMSEKLKKAEIICSKMSGKNVNAVGSDLQNLVKAFLSGNNIIWSDYFSDCKRIPLPTYSFDEDKYWIDIGYRKEGSGSINRKNPNIDEWFYTPMYMEEDFSDKQPDLTKKWLIIEPEGDSISNKIREIYPNLSVTTTHLNANSALFYAVYCVFVSFFNIPCENIDRLINGLLFGNKIWKIRRKQYRHANIERS